MPEWKLHNPENDRKITPQKITEKSNLENARREIAHPGKYQNGKCTTWKMTEKSHSGKLQKIDNLNLLEWKIHTPENASTVIARPGN